eukprot:TRINITY_DN2648_c0_g1_i1.p1 TRINITY_DN2648_c0_g1~~TRINITY_DN2648_c0_g1_i1.p1  ORF type:complete len:671 (+),score=124.07 TRINITY_DN2648_c0_g1_i1:99-2015(+)
MSAVQKQGWLVKQGHFIKNWKPRWMVLTFSQLVYFVGEPKTAGEAGYRQRGYVPLFGAAIDPVVIVGRSFTFTITKTVNRKDFLIQASSESDMTAWVEALRRCALGGDRSTDSAPVVEEVPTATIFERITIPEAPGAAEYFSSTPVSSALAGLETHVPVRRGSAPIPMPSSPLTPRSRVISKPIVHNSESPPAPPAPELLCSAAARGDLEECRTLMRLGALGNATFSGFAPLHLAAKAGHRDVVVLLIQCTVDVSMTDDNGWTALHHAARHNQEQCCAILLQNGAPVDAVESAVKCTALAYAARFGFDAVCRLLLEHDATVDTFTIDGLTPLFQAAVNGHANVCETLLKNGADVNVTCGELQLTPLYAAAQDGHVQCCEVLLDHGASPNVRSGATESPLLITACSLQHTQICTLLIDRGADVNMVMSDGTSPLFVAAQNGMRLVVMLLLQRGADVNAFVVESSHSPLHIAAQQGHNEVVDALLKSGASADVVDSNGETPLWSAACYGYHEVVEILIAAGANLNAANNDGLTPLHAAAKNQHIVVCRRLLAAGAVITEALQKDPYAGDYVAAVEMVLRRPSIALSLDSSTHSQQSELPLTPMQETFLGGLSSGELSPMRGFSSADVSPSTPSRLSRLLL